MTEITSQPDSPEMPEDQMVDDGILRFKRSHVYAALLPLAFVTGFASGYLLLRNQPSNTTGQVVAQSGGQPAILEPAAQPLPQPPSGLGQTPTRLGVEVDDDPAIGPTDAPITIVEFSDFKCPYCRRFHEETFQQLIDAYPDKIRFVYRDFPVVGGYEAAQASECADEQGSYWEFHNLLFSGGLGSDEDSYRQYAEDLGLDADALMECLDEGRYASEVEDDARYAASLGVNATPTFFINGIPLIGAQPLENFTKIIDDELEGE